MQESKAPHHFALKVHLLLHFASPHFLFLKHSKPDKLYAFAFKKSPNQAT